MTFIQGERREEAFEEQEERRALTTHDKRDAAAALDALLGVVGDERRVDGQRHADRRRG